MAGRILIADAVDSTRSQLEKQLAAARYEVLAAGNAEDALRLAREATPDLALIDERIGEGGGIDFCRQLRSRPDTNGIAAIILADRGDSEIKLEALKAGADELLMKPLDPMMLMARVRSLMRARETAQELGRRRTAEVELGFAEVGATFEAQGRIGFVTAKPATGEAWRESMRGLLRHRIETLTEHQAVGGDGIDVYVIAADLEEPGRGLQLLADLRSRPGTRHAAILVVVERGDTTSAAMALDLGANDLVTADFDPPELAMRLRTQLRRKREADRLRAAVDEGLRLAVIDPLTGLYNRRYAMTYLAGIAGRAADTGRTYAVMVADLDRFKAVNDTHGHQAGDAILTEVGRRLRDNLRSFDLVARIGGEEFLIALPETSYEAARIAGERLRRVTSDTPIKIGNDREITVTLSIGVAVSGTSELSAPETVSGILERADIALYAAKREGRDQVNVSRPAA